MKLKHILMLSALAIGMSSCINDDSTTASGTTSKLSLAQPLAETYTMNRWDTLHIEPQVQQTNAQKELAYEWEIDYKVVSTEKNLEYICANFGKYPARLKVTNGDDIKYYEFNVDVQYSYLSGLYILGQMDGKAIVSYLPDGVEGKKFDLDVLAKNNPGVDFSGEPQSIDNTVTSSKVSLLYLAVGNPSKVYEINPNLMSIGFTTQAAGEVNWVKRDPRNYPENTIVMEDHKLKTLRMLSPSAKLTNYSSAWEKKVNNESFSMAPHLAAWWREDLRYLHAIAYFDNAKGHLLAQGSEYPQMPVELLAGTFTGDSLIGMGSVNEQRNLVMVTRNNTQGKYFFYHLFPGYYTSVTEKVQPSAVKYKLEMTAATGMQRQSVVRSTPTKNLVYYSSGNKVYAYNVLSNGNFPTSALFTVGDATETIVDMRLNATDSKLFVATNAAAGTMQGSVYCFDLIANKMLWQQRNVTGKIKQMTYRN